MTTATIASIDHYLELFAERDLTAEPAWLAPIRKSAIARFGEMGFPTPQDEDWTFTNVGPIVATPFDLPTASGQLPKSQLESMTFGFPVRLVFVDGRFANELSQYSNLAPGLTVAPISQAIAQDLPGVKAHLAKYASNKHDGFASLNTAFFQDGVFVHIAAGKVIEQPIEILHLQTEAGRSTIDAPRSLLLADANSQGVVIERFLALSEGIGNFTTSVCETVIGENASLEHYWIEEGASDAFHVSLLRGTMSRSARYQLHTMLLGGRLVRSNVHLEMAGEGCDSLINGLYLGNGKQHLDNNMRMEHAAPHGSSRQVYRGILDDHSRGVFAGRIHVHPGAQKTDAKQSNQNLLLSKHAEADTKPQLEIYADDVKCTHGATVGQMDETALFYLRARGINKEMARNMLVHAFASECLGRMNVAAVKTYMETRISEKLSKRLK